MPQSYKNLLTYRLSLFIYDLTVAFCQRWILDPHIAGNIGYAPDKRLADQMVQAARSGKQNIAEGSADMPTSMKMAIKLTNVASASLEELIEDYEDFLRARGKSIWDKADSRTLYWRSKTATLVGNLGHLSNLSNLSPLQMLPLPTDPEIAANLLLTLCHQATYLLSRQIAAMEQKHIQEGGYTEKLYNQRIEYRRRHGQQK